MTEPPPISPDTQEANSAAAVARAGSSRLIKRIALAFLILLIIVVIAITVIFLNRNAFLEQLIIRNLAGRGLTAELTLVDYDGRSAHAKNIDIHYQGERVFKADDLKLTFDLDALLDGKVKSVALSSAFIHLTLDENFRPIDPFLPKGEGDAALPVDGMTLDDVTAALDTPYGDVRLSGSGRIDSAALFDLDASIRIAAFDAAPRIEGLRADLLIAEGSFQRRDQALTIDGAALSADRAEAAGFTARRAQLDITGVARLPAHSDAPVGFDGRLAAKIDALSGQSFSGDTSATFTGEAELTRQGVLAIEGQADLDLGAFETPVLSASGGQAQFDGLFIAGRGGVQNADGMLEAQLNRAQFIDEDLAGRLAGTVTGEGRLDELPIAEAFVPQIRDDVRSLLTRFDLRFAAQLEADADRQALTLTEPVIIDNGAQRLRLTGLSAPLLLWQTEALSLSARAALDGAYDLTADVSMTGPAQNGRAWSEVDRLSVQLRTAEPWQAQNATLGNLNARINLTRRRGGDFAISMDTQDQPLRYSGVLLGAQLTELTASGKLSIAGDSIRFDPRAPISVSQIDPGGEWLLSDVALTPLGSAAIIRREGGRTLLEENFENVTAVLQDRSDERVMTVKAQRLELSGELDAKADYQGFDLIALGAEAYSAQWPAKDMLAKTLRAEIGLQRAQGGEWEYGVASPDLSVRAEPVTLRNMAFEISGNGSDLLMSYKDGKVALKGSGLPAIPLSGTAELVDGRLSGEAETFLPKAPAFPVFATYSYENGRGVADIDVPRFVFSPNGVQPQDLVPALRGKLADVKGLASAKAKLVYETGKPVQSEGAVTLTKLDAGTLVGPFTGISTEIAFSSLFPLITEGEQVLTMTGFDPGVPLGSGTVRFALIENGIDLRDARWPLDPGQIVIRPTIWRLDERQNKVIVEIQGVSLGILAARLSNGKVTATGEMTGTLPIIVDGVDVTVQQGRVEVVNGGTIRMDIESFRDKLEGSRAGQMLAQFLSEFNYQSLYIEANGPLDGELTMGLDFIARNPDVLDGQAFDMSIVVTGELVNIGRNLAKSFSGEDLQNIIERARR